MRDVRFSIWLFRHPSLQQLMFDPGVDPCAGCDQVRRVAGYQRRGVGVEEAADLLFAYGDFLQKRRDGFAVVRRIFES